MEIRDLEKLWDMQKTYMMSLQGKLEFISWQIENEFDLFKKNPAKDIFEINGRELAPWEFTLFLGREYYFYKNFQKFVFFKGSRKNKEIFREVEAYLRSIPGMVMPEVPELVKEWLLEQD